MRLLDDLLEQVEQLLPDYRESLEEKCDAAQQAIYFRCFEARIGTTLPPEYYALYRQFNGENLGLAFGWFFTSLGRAEARLQAAADGWYASPDNPDQVRPQSHGSRRIPLAEDYSGTIIYLDYDPAPHGTPGQLILIFRDNPTTIYSVAPSLRVFLEMILAELVAGRVISMEDEAYLEFACIDGRRETFWKDLSNRWRSQELVLPAGTEAQFAALSPLWREKLAQENDSFTSTQLHRVRSLLVNDNAMLPDLANILLFPNARTLELFAYPITAGQLELVAQTKVAFLTLRGVLPDLAPLSRLTTLRTLSLSDATVESLEPLAALCQLETLELELVAVPDLRPLAGLTELKVLKLENSTWQKGPVEWPSLAVLGSLPNLTSLDVAETDFSDLSALLAFPQLKHVDLADCPITYFSAARALPDGLSFCGNGDFLEGILAVAPDKGFRFDSISGDMDDAQEELWRIYLDKQRNDE